MAQQAARPRRVEWHGDSLSAARTKRSEPCSSVDTVIESTDRFRATDFRRLVFSAKLVVHLLLRQFDDCGIESCQGRLKINAFSVVDECLSFCLSRVATIARAVCGCVQ